MSVNRIGPAHPEHPAHRDRPCCDRRHELDQLRAHVRNLADDLDAGGWHDLADRLRDAAHPQDR